MPIRTLVAPDSFWRSDSSCRPPKVSIVGAGIAGLTCATRLFDAGADVTVYEARARVGGRAYTDRRDARGVVELGGEFIGENHLTWKQLARDHNLQLIPAVALASHYIYQDRRLASPLAERVGAVRAQAQQALCALAAEVDADAPWTASNAQALDALSVGAWAREQNLPDAMHTHALLGMFEGYAAVPADCYSLLAQLALIKGGGGADYWTQSDIYRCQEGSDALPARLSTYLGAACVVKEAVVTGIDFGPRPTLWVRPKDASHATPISTDFIVNTAPSAVLNDFSYRPHRPLPGLPQMGCAVKKITFCGAGDPPLLGTYYRFGPEGFESAGWGIQDHLGRIFAHTDFIPHVMTEALRKGLPSWTADRFRMLSATHEMASADRPSIVTSWQDDPYSRGAYPAPAPGEVTRLGPKLYAAHGPLQFAGDFDYAFGGYMEGAARSGVRAAERILREMD